MKNRVIGLESGRVLLKDEALYISQSKIKTVEEFDKAIAKQSMMNPIKIIPVEKIKKIYFNEKDAGTNLVFINKKGKEKEHSFGFSTEEASNDFGHFLGGELMFDRSEKKEGRLQPFLINGIFAALGLGMVLYFISPENFQDFITTSSSSGRSGRRSEMVKAIFAVIGRHGSMAIGAIAVIYCSYSIFKRFKEPAMEVSYTKPN